MGDVDANMGDVDAFLRRVSVWQESVESLGTRASVPKVRSYHELSEDLSIKAAEIDAHLSLGARNPLSPVERKKPARTDDEAGNLSPAELKIEISDATGAALGSIRAALGTMRSTEVAAPAAEAAAGAEEDSELKGARPDYNDDDAAGGKKDDPARDDLSDSGEYAYANDEPLENRGFSEDESGCFAYDDADDAAAVEFADDAGPSDAKVAAVEAAAVLRTAAASKASVAAHPDLPEESW